MNHSSNCLLHYFYKLLGYSLTSKIYNISTSMNSTNATNATNSNRRATLIRDQVGCPKMTFRDLPSPNYCYGVKSKRESTGVNEIFRNWENIYKKKTIKRDKNIISITPVEVHGLKTILSPYPIKNIVQTDYTNYDTHDAAYPKIPLRKKIITFPAPKATLSSALAKMCQERKLASQQEVEPFKMSRFSKVPSRLSIAETRTTATN